MILRSKCLPLIVLFFLLFCSTYSVCPHGYFKLQSMPYCFPWLTCRDISRIKLQQLIGYGSTKNVYLALWNQRNVTYISLRNRNFRYDYHNGLQNLVALSPNESVVQLLGFCQEEDIIITEYHEYNNALGFTDLKDKLTLKERFQFCLYYAKIIHFLHNSPTGVRVNCDSNDLNKLLSQFLITSNLRLVLCDTDALPELKTNQSIKCGSKEIKSNFVAPEQLWHKSSPFNIKRMKGYNEKTDIWKLPDVCLYFLKNEDVELLQYMLFGVHNRCKEKDPMRRPSAKEVINLYNEIFMFL